MKLFVALAGLYLSTNLFAGSGTFQISYSEGSGFTRPEWQFGKSCVITTSKVSKSHRLGFYKVDLKTDTPISLSGDVIGLIKAAAQEKWIDAPAICDATSKATIASYSENGKKIDVLLYSFSSCSGKDGEMEGPAATQLLAMVESLCK